MRRRMSPRETRSVSDICRLRTDHMQTARAWLSVDEGVVHICQMGGISAGDVTLTRGDFHRMIRWYLRAQTLRASPHGSA